MPRQSKCRGSAAEALKKFGTATAAANALKIPRTTFQSWLAREQFEAGAGKPPDEVARLRQLLAAETAKAVGLEDKLALKESVRAPIRLKKYAQGKFKKTLGAKHLFVPDPQCKEGVPMGHLAAAGHFAVAKRPDTIVIAGDWWDMPSLSSYDRGKLQFEGRRYKTDIEAGIAGMELFLKPIQKAKNYRPRIVVTLGNHENRVVRVVEEDSRLAGTIGQHDFKLEEMGLEVYPFLATFVSGGITYTHYFPRSANGKITQTRAGAPNAKAQLVRQGGTAVAGHTQGLDAACLPLQGRLQWGIQAGSFYQHEEDYLSPQGTAYWRGVVMLHQVVNGACSPMFVDLNYLLEKYA